MGALKGAEDFQETQGPTCKNDPSQAPFETQGRQGKQCGAPEEPRKSRSLVVCPHENMRANFLGMTAVSLFARSQDAVCGPTRKSELGKNIERPQVCRRKRSRPELQKLRRTTRTPGKPSRMQGAQQGVAVPVAKNQGKRMRGQFESVYINAPQIFAACAPAERGAAQFPRGGCSEL